jgi:anti-sigma factor RsiW
MACPEDIEETAEAYLMNRLEPGEAEAFARHIETCPDCARTTEEAEEFLDSMRGAAKKLRSEGPG